MAAMHATLSLWVSFLMAGILIGSLQGHPHEEEVEHAVDHESHLYYHLLDHYVRDIRPAANDTDPVRVAVKLSILNLDGPEFQPAEVGNGPFPTVILLLLVGTVAGTASWHDPRLKWNLTDYAGLQTLSLSSHQIWQPELTPLESEILNSGHGPDEAAAITHKGDVSVMHTEKAHLTCTPVNPGHFPSDSLRCDVTLMSTSYNSKELKLVLDAYQTMEEAYDVSMAAPETGWKLDKEGTEFVVQVKGARISGSGHPGIKISLVFHRERNFYWNLCVIPAAFLAFLIPLEFILPPGSNTKAIMGVVIALGEIIVLAELSTAWAGGASIIPNAGLFCVSSIVVSCLAAILSTLLNSLTPSGSRYKDVPHWLRSLCFGRCGIRRFVCLDAYSPVGASSRMEGFHRKNGAIFIDPEPMAVTDQGTRPAQDAVQPEVLKDLHSLVTRLTADDMTKRVTEEWQEVVRVLERMFFVIFSLLVLATAFAFLF